MEVYDFINNIYQKIDENDFFQNYEYKNRKYCIGYARQSTKYQKSLEEQISEIKLQAKKDNFDSIIIFKNYGSGWNINNINKLPEFKKMVKLIKSLSYTKIREFTIYIYDVSRFMRNVLIATKFINDVFNPYNCKIISIIDNKIWDKNKQNRINFLRELVEAESNSVLLSAKMKKNVSYRRKRGHHVGGIPYGFERYRDHNLIFKLRKNKYEQNILGYIKKNCKKKKDIFYYKKSNVIKYMLNLPALELSNILNNNGISNRNKKWNSGMINRIINSDKLNNVDECELSNTNCDNWLQCDKCNKWRRVNLKYYNMFKDSMNFYCDNLICLNCNIPEEKEEDENQININFDNLNISNNVSNKMKNLII
jgi:DNA invertase Pin-like site-specific DNA recombinase